MLQHYHPFAIWAGYRIELEFIYDMCVPSRFLEHEESRSETVSAWLVRKGRVEVQSDNDRAIGLPGQWLICAGRKIAHKIEPDTHLLSLRMHLEWPVGPSLLRGNTLHVVNESVWPDLEAKALDLVRAIPRIRDTYANGFFHYLWGEDDFSFAQYVLYRERLHRWMGSLIEVLLSSGREFHEPGPIDPRLRKIVAFLKHHPLSSAFPKESLERIGGVQIKRLNQICSDTFGMTLHSLWDQQRYNYAQQTLRFSYLSIKEVASNLGFKRLQHFSSWFRTHCGLSPRDFRKVTLKSTDEERTRFADTPASREGAGDPGPPPLPELPN